jgi:hypothetical protein
MSEAEWLEVNDSRPMLAFLKGKASDRKLRLVACASCRRFWDDIEKPVHRQKITTAEKYADGAITEKKYLKVCPANAPTQPRNRRTLGELLFFATNALGWPDSEQPYLDIDESGQVISRPWETGEYMVRYTLRATMLAAEVIATRNVGPGVEAGTRLFKQARQVEYVSQAHLLRDIIRNPFRPVSLDPSWLTSTVVSLATGIYADSAFDRSPILADALQDSGCQNDELLNHHRGPGPHCKGCWALDLLLGKS